MVTGVRGALTDSWDYDVSATYSRVSLSRTYQNDFSVTRLGRALNVVDVAGVAHLPIGYRWYGSGLRSVEHLRSERRHSGGSELPADPAHSARRNDPTGRSRHGQWGLGLRQPGGRVEHPNGVRCRISPRRTELDRRHELPIGRRRRPRRSHEPALGRRGRVRSVHGSENSADRGRAACGPALDGRRLPLFGVQLRHDHQYLQGRRRVGSVGRHPPPRKLPARGARGQHHRVVRGSGRRSVQHGLRPVRRRQQPGPAFRLSVSV